MDFPKKFLSVFNSIMNDSQFGIKGFVERYESTLSETPMNGRLKKIYFILKNMVDKEVDLIQMGSGKIPYIFKKNNDTDLKAIENYIEDFNKVIRDTRRLKKSKRIRSMKKAPDLQSIKPQAEEKAKWFVTPTVRQIMQQKFETLNQTIKTLKQEKANLIDEVQQLTAELRGRQTSHLEELDITFLNNTEV